MSSLTAPRAKPIPSAPAREALTDAGALAAITLSLATGALVFSVGLLTAASSHLWLLPRICLIASWVLLAVSIVSGVMVRSRIPIKLRDQDYDLDEPGFSNEGAIHAGTFVTGALALGAALFFTLIAIPIQRVPAVSSAREATDRAKTELTKDERSRLNRFDLVELVKGGDDQMLPEGTWHVRFGLRASAGAGRKSVPGAVTIDVVVPVRGDGPLRRLP